MKLRIGPTLLAMLFTLVGWGCAIFDDADEVVQNDENTSTECAFLGEETGVCADGIPNEAGECLPPIGYETVEVSCDQLDNDCDGDIDPGCPCNYRDLDAGVCSGGVEDDGDCAEPDGFEDDEVTCDGLDNDCDGTVDEGCPCDFRQIALGVCASEIGDDGTCAVPSDYEGSELSCDGVDNDCDGDVDEDLRGACELDRGVCAQAVTDCVNGDFADCSPTDYGPNFEPDEVTCEGLDNDCDGVVDEACGCAFDGSVVGVCAAGLVDDQGACAPPNTYEDDETACDDLDNDCDGTVDEGCPCGAGVIRACGTDDGGCETGVQTCGSNETWGPCEDAVLPEPEACDGVDNDCDGDTDEQLRVDCQRQQGVCAGATMVCDFGGADETARACTTEQLLEHSPEFEPDESRCDQRDNDCDGAVDEGCPCQWNDTPVGVCGSAKNDDAGACAEPDGYEIDEISCDGEDNDCDSVTDEKCPCPYLGLTDGVCSEGRISESSGVCLAPPAYSSTDASCDRRDNDCDGRVDEDAPSVESNCANGKDDDCDGKKDCDDPDCLGKICDVAAVQDPKVMALEEEQTPVESSTCQSDGSCR